MVTSPVKSYKERKLKGRNPWPKPARTQKGKWIRFYLFLSAAILLLLLAIVGPYITPCDPIATDFMLKLQPPSAEHWFGTDNVGRDVFARIVYGAGNSFSMAFFMIAIVAAFGTTVGIISGYFGGMVDTVIMRIADILLAFPDTIFAIALVGTMGPGLLNTILALSLIWWTKYARVTRGLAYSLRNREFITQARFGGASTGRILVKYIFPNILPQVLIMATLDIGGMMLSLASLSFLGLASQPPTPEWGYMLYEGKMYMQSAPWLIWFPGLALFVAVIVFNLLGDSLRDILDPKDRE